MTLPDVVGLEEILSGNAGKQNIYLRISPKCERLSVSAHSAALVTALQSSKNLSLCRPPPCRPDFMKFHVFHGSAFTLQRSAFGGEAHQVRK